MTVELAAQNAGQILTLKYNANRFVKVGAQIGKECRRTISYLQRCAYPYSALSRRSCIANCIRRRFLAIKVWARIPLQIGDSLSALFLFKHITIYTSCQVPPETS